MDVQYEFARDEDGMCGALLTIELDDGGPPLKFFAAAHEDDLCSMAREMAQECVSVSGSLGGDTSYESFTGADGGAWVVWSKPGGLFASDAYYVKDPHNHVAWGPTPFDGDEAKAAVHDQAIRFAREHARAALPPLPDDAVLDPRTHLYHSDATGQYYDPSTHRITDLPHLPADALFDPSSNAYYSHATGHWYDPATHQAIVAPPGAIVPGSAPASIPVPTSPAPLTTPQPVAQPAPAPAPAAAAPQLDIAALVQAIMAAMGAASGGSSYGGGGYGGGYDASSSYPYPSSPYNVYGGQPGAWDPYSSAMPGGYGYGYPADIVAGVGSLWGDLTGSIDKIVQSFLGSEVTRQAVEHPDTPQEVADAMLEGAGIAAQAVTGGMALPIAHELIDTGLHSRDAAQRLSAQVAEMLSGH